MKSEFKRDDKVMKLKSVRLVNYRCFTDTEIEFDEHVTLMVGKNGAGKTAILDAVAVSVSSFLLGIDGGVSRSILKDDARYEFHDLNGTIDPQHQFPVSIESSGDCLDQKNVKWVRSLNSESGKTTIKDAGELTGFAKKAQNQIMTGDKSLVLPLISYYGTGRLYAQKKEKRNLKSLTEFKRQVGYVDCMAAESNEKLMLNWFQIQTLKSLQEQLNLNCQALSLPQTRKNVLMAEKNGIMRKCKGKSQDAFMRELERTYTSLAQERNLTPYCGIIISWLESKLKIS